MGGSSNSTWHVFKATRVSGDRQERDLMRKPPAGEDVRKCGTQGMPVRAAWEARAGAETNSQLFLHSP